ncbi:MAG: porin [Nitrosospira sp.]|nr:porin [Nitrosospira sp.]
MAVIVAGSLLSFAMSTTGAQANGSLNNLIMPQLFKDKGIEIGGWINGGATFNPSHSTLGYNGPVTFGDRANQAQMNQLNFFLQRAVVTEGKSWDLGFRADFLFGTDAIFTQAYGNPAADVNNNNILMPNRGAWDLDLCCNSSRNYGIALPQAFVEAYAPIGNGLNVKAGHFYTPIGYESVPAPNNFFYSHAYTMQYGEPFTHTGVLTNYNVDKNVVFMSGAITGSGTGGWDGNFNRQMDNWGGIGGLTYTTDDKRSSANISGTGSQVSSRSNAFWGMYSVVLKHMITPKTHFILQHDHGYADNVQLSYGQGQAQWYGINTHAYYDVTTDFSVGVRGEWFRDRDGFRVWQPGRVAAGNNVGPDNALHSYAVHGGGNLSGSQASDYYAVTIGANWKPAKRLKIETKALQQFNIRPNIRYDRADSLTTAAYRPFGGHKDQVLFSMDFMLPF